MLEKSIESLSIVEVCIQSNINKVISVSAVFKDRVYQNIQFITFSYQFNPPK